MKKERVVEPRMRIKMWGIAGPMLKRKQRWMGCLRRDDERSCSRGDCAAQREREVRMDLRRWNSRKRRMMMNMVGLMKRRRSSNQLQERDEGKKLLLERVVGEGYIGMILLVRARGESAGI